MELRPDMPVIICTGHSDEIDATSAAEMGVAAFLIKPIDRIVLARTVRAVLDSI